MESPGANEALFYKSMAEEKFQQSKLKSALKYARRALRHQADLKGVSEMVTAFKILHCVSSHDHPNYYEILGVQPSAQMRSIHKQYRALVMALHPNKNVHAFGCLEALNHVEKAFRVLTDKHTRKDYDLSLHFSQPNITLTHTDTFWTACSTCRLLHQFERRYVGHHLVCPNCRKGFLALEETEEDEVRNISNMVQDSRSMGDDNLKKVNVFDQKGYKGVSSSFRKKVSLERKRKRETGVKSRDKEEKHEAEKPKRREKTLAEMQLALRRKLEMSKHSVKGKKGIKDHLNDGKTVVAVPNQCDDHPIRMLVQDSDFYDFDMDRMEQSFKKGQIWALHDDDDDGMPRQYGLINDVYSLHPFSISISWLNAHSNAWGTSIFSFGGGTGFIPTSCGRFKAERVLDINSVSMFSHVVKGDRVAKGIYGIFPKKGSVWALYHGERPLNGKLENSSRYVEDRSYDIVVLLTSYSEIHGLSAAYLEKVEGFKTIFKRSEVGFHAVKWFEKDDLGSFSHQIPARKLSGEEAPNLPKECWELDPASLPPSSLRIDN